jgi:cell shape-determining protein MreD
MKIICTYVFLGIAIVVGQTTILKLTFLQNGVYDLLIPMVVFARLNLSVKTAGVIALVMGYVMDLFSGGQFGLYITSYLWILIGVKVISGYFSIQGSISRAILIALCVLFENVIFFLFSGGPVKEVLMEGHKLRSVILQTSLAAISGPVIVMGLERIYQRIEGVE